MLKKIVIGVVGLLVLIVVAVVVVVSTIDANRYKPQIEKAAMDKFGRTLKFDGDLKLRALPRVAVNLPHTTLSEHGSEQNFLSLDSARVAVPLIPLLRGKVEVGTASLYGLRVSIVRHADGTTNIDDLTGAHPGQEAQPKEAAPKKLPEFEVGGIDLKDAQVTITDERTHNTTTLSKLNLSTDRIANRARTPVDFSGSVSMTSPPAHFDATLKTVADIDLPAQAIGLSELKAHVVGASGNDKIDATLSSPDFAFDPSHGAHGQMKLQAVASGAHPVRADLSLENLSGEGDKFSIGKIVGLIDLQSDALPQKSLKVNLDGSLQADKAAQTVAANLVAHFDETTAKSRVDVRGFSAPQHIEFEVDIDRLNLDRYLPPSPAEAKPASAQAADATKVDMSPLKTLDMQGQVRIGSLQMHNLKASKIQVGVRAAGGQLDVNPMSASLYEGALNGRAKANAASNHVSVAAVLDKVSIGPAMRDMMGKDLLEGNGNVKLDVATAGATVGAMKRELGGNASVVLRDGTLHGFSLDDTVHNLKSKIAGGGSKTGEGTQGGKTAFKDMSASFQIKNGIADNNDLKVESALGNIQGAGKIDLVDNSVAYTAKASAAGMTIPVKVSGPFAALSYNVDVGGALSSEAGKLESEVKKKPAEALKGLLHK